MRSMSAVLVASTLTPGSTAPVESLTAPAIPLCAAATAGRDQTRPTINAMRHARPSVDLMVLLLVTGRASCAWGRSDISGYPDTGSMTSSRLEPTRRASGLSTSKGKLAEIQAPIPSGNRKARRDARALQCAPWRLLDDAAR